MPQSLFPQPAAQSLFANREPVEAVPAEEDTESGWSTALGAGAMGVGVLGAGLAARNPKAAWEGAKTVGRGLSAARNQTMLSGLAIPKSVLGNIGATAVESAERGTLAPLRSLFSMDTARDIKKLYKAGPAAGSQYGTSIPGPTPGRIMGALDEAARNALVRSGTGITPQDAERIMFQAPLPSGLGKALDNPVMRYLVPFRRTPFNQLIEGGKTFAPETFRQGATLGASLFAGATHGATTADEQYPVTVGLGAAAAAKYGLPYSMGALAGRALAGGQGGGGLASTAVPVGEFGIESSVIDPFKLLEDPPAAKAWRRLFGE